MLVRHVLSQLSYAPEAFACWTLATLKQRSLLYPKHPHLSIGFFQFFIFLLQSLSPPESAQNSNPEKPLGRKAFLSRSPFFPLAGAEANPEEKRRKIPGTAVRRDIFFKKNWPPSASFRRVKWETVKKIFVFRRVRQHPEGTPIQKRTCHAIGQVRFFSGCGCCILERRLLPDDHPLKVRSAVLPIPLFQKRGRHRRTGRSSLPGPVRRSANAIPLCPC